MSQLFKIMLLSITVSAASGDFVCSNPSEIVCDHIPGTEDYISSMIADSQSQCQESCSIGHYTNLCEFYTWFPNAGIGEANCYHLSACHIVPFSTTQEVTSGPWNCSGEVHCEETSDQDGMVITCWATPQFSDINSNDDSNKCTLFCDGSLGFLILLVLLMFLLLFLLCCCVAEGAI